MKTAFKAYTDAGHGWVAVKRRLLIELGILDKITRFSYQRGLTVYLEEDCDVATFVEAYKNEHGHMPTFIEGSWVDCSPIRSYENFSLTNDERAMFAHIRFGTE
jgi:hypothetical protein